MITSLQNEKVKLAHLLQTRSRSRRREGRIALEGTRLIGDALDSGQRPEFVLYDPQTADGALLDRLRAGGADPLAVAPAVMTHISDTPQPQGVLAVFPLPADDLPAVPVRVLILDAIRDPGNLGTILRTAAAASVQAVLLAPTCADPYNPKALRSAMGAHFRLPLAERGWEQIRRYCAKLPVYLADSQGELGYDQADWSVGWALMIGGEAHGAGDEAARLATTRIRIPMAAHTESLNAAVAAGVILFEARRQMNP